MNGNIDVSRDCCVQRGLGVEYAALQISTINCGSTSSSGDMYDARMA